MKATIALLLAALSGAAFAQQSRIEMLRAPLEKQVFRVGTQALDSFQGIVNQTNFKRLGFQNPGEVKSAKLGVPFPVFMVRLDDLRAYKDGVDPRTLLRDLDKVVFPVLVNDEVRSSVTVERRDNVWRGTSFGSPGLARAFDGTRRLSASANSVSPVAFAMVHVAALNRHYLAHQSSGKMFLTTVVEDPVLKLRAGRTVQADQVFLALVPIAKRHDGNPS